MCVPTRELRRPGNAHTRGSGEVRPWPWPFFVRSGCAGSPGCGPLTAAKIVAETADVTRFSSEAAFACHAGLVPRPAWSGATSGTLRAGRRGNRHLNRALRKIALTQTRMDGPGKAYVERRVAAGDNKVTALRCLKRKLARVLYRRLLADHDARHPVIPPRRKRWERVIRLADWTSPASRSTATSPSTRSLKLPSCGPCSTPIRPLHNRFGTGA